MDMSHLAHKHNRFFPRDCVTLAMRFNYVYNTGHEFLRSSPHLYGESTCFPPPHHNNDASPAPLGSMEHILRRTQSTTQFIHFFQK